LATCSSLLTQAGYTVSHQQEPWLAGSGLYTLLAVRS
jgi:hypothetical protein